MHNNNAIKITVTNRHKLAVFKICGCVNSSFRENGFTGCQNELALDLLLDDPDFFWNSLDKSGAGPEARSLKWSLKWSPEKSSLWNRVARFFLVQHTKTEKNGHKWPQIIPNGHRIYQMSANRPNGRKKYHVIWQPCFGIHQGEQMIF
jgi:hypothetical protein